MENTYEEVVLQTVMKDILQGEQGGAARKNRAALANGAERGSDSRRRLRPDTGLSVP